MTKEIKWGKPQLSNLGQWEAGKTVTDWLCEMAEPIEYTEHEGYPCVPHRFTYKKVLMVEWLPHWAKLRFMGSVNKDLPISQEHLFQMLEAFYLAWIS
jgi:hypothetical protein